MSEKITLNERVDLLEGMQEFITENLVETLAKLNALCELLVISGKLTQKQMEELEVLAEANKDMLAIELMGMADEEDDILGVEEQGT
jgi:hypothetical protein